MFNCDFCAYVTSRASDFERHNNSKRHIKIVNNSNILKNVAHFGQSNVKTCDQIDNLAINLGQKISNSVQNGQLNMKTCDQIDNFVNSFASSVQNGQSEKKPTKKQNLEKQYEQSEIDTENDHKHYKCECLKVYSNKQSLCKHRKKCTERHNINKILKLENEIIGVKTDNVKLREQILELKSELLKYMHHNNQTITDSQNVTNSHNTVNNNQKIISVFNYVSSNYETTPILQELKTHDIKKLLVIKENTKYPIEDHFIFHHKKHSLDRFLGEIIKGEYQTDDPEEQQFWTTNVAKLTFMVRKFLKTEQWSKDMKGTEICRNIIDPILKEIRKMLQKYTKRQIDQNTTLNEIETMQANNVIAIAIISDINTQKLHIKILNYIAPHFQLRSENKKNLIIYESEVDE